MSFSDTKSATCFTAELAAVRGEAANACKRPGKLKLKSGSPESFF